MAAIVGAHKRGSLLLSDTCFTNRSTSWHPGMKHFGNEERDELISIVSFDNFHIPLFCLLVVISTEKLFTCFLGTSRKVKVVIPVNCFWVPSDFVSPVIINSNIAFF